MNTKQYLSQIERLDRMIQNKLSEIYQLRQMAQSITVKPKEVDVQSTGDYDKLGTTVTKIVYLEEETDKLVDKYIDMRKKIVSQIDSMEDTKVYNILSEKYVVRKDWNRICVEMNYSSKQMSRLHKRALQEFEKKFGKEYL